MKKQFKLSVLVSITILIFVCNVQSQTNEQTKSILVNDFHNLGVYYDDTSTVNHKLGEVKIDKSLPFRKKSSSLKKDLHTNDTTNSYQIHFFKMYENKLRNYEVSYIGNDEFDKAIYKWLNDTTVNVILINSNTNKRKSFKLGQTFCKGCSASLAIDAN